MQINTPRKISEPKDNPLTQTARTNYLSLYTQTILRAESGKVLFISQTPLLVIFGHFIEIMSAKAKLYVLFTNCSVWSKSKKICSFKKWLHDNIRKSVRSMFLWFSKSHESLCSVKLVPLSCVAYPSDVDSFCHLVILLCTLILVIRYNEKVFILLMSQPNSTSTLVGSDKVLSRTTPPSETFKAHTNM